MKHTTVIASFIATGLLAAAPASAELWGGVSSDTYGSVLHDLDKPAFIGTGLSMESPRIDIYNGAFSGPDLDGSGFALGKAGPERGQGETYGWAVLDVIR
jgi:hypothetical protein